MISGDKLKTVADVAAEFKKAEVWVYKMRAAGYLDREGKYVVVNDKYTSFLAKQRETIKKSAVGEWHDYNLLTLKSAAAQKNVSIDTIKRWIASKYIRSMVVENALGNQIKGVVNDERFKAMEKLK